MRHRSSSGDVTASLGVYVVNLTRRLDRRLRIQALLDTFQYLSCHVTVTFTSDWAGPYDGLTLTRAQLLEVGADTFPWQIASANPWWGRPLKTGEVGCTLAHWDCWQDAAHRGFSHALVIEDDAVLSPHLIARLQPALNFMCEQPKDVGLLYLGRYPLEPDRSGTQTFPGLVVPGYSHCTFGYILTRTGLIRALTMRLNESIIPADEFLPAMYLNHPRPDVRARFPRQFDALAFDPPLVTQLPKDLAGSDTEDSPFVAW